MVLALFFMKGLRMRTVFLEFTISWLELLKTSFYATRRCRVFLWKEKLGGIPMVCPQKLKRKKSWGFVRKKKLRKSESKNLLENAKKISSPTRPNGKSL